MKKKILSVGEILWDQFPDGDVLGGAPFNFAYRASLLDNESYFVSRVGEDALGRKAIDQARALGMDTHLIQVDPEHPTGVVKVTVDEKGNPDFLIVPDVAYDYLEATEAALEVAAHTDCFCFGTLIQRAPRARESLLKLLEAAQGALKFLDINLRKDCYSSQTVSESIQRSDVLKLNDQEVHYLADLMALPNDPLSDFCDRLLDETGLKVCVVTLGERGALAACKEQGKVYEPGRKVDVVDTCGSGDAFSAGFIHGLLQKQSLAQCCRLGTALGAMVAAQPGATGRITLEQVQRFLESRPEEIVDPALEKYRAS